MTTLADLSDKEFEQMLDSMSKPEYDDLASEEFFKILNAFAAPIRWSYLRTLKRVAI